MYCCLFQKLNYCYTNDELSINLSSKAPVHKGQAYNQTCLIIRSVGTSPMRTSLSPLPVSSLHLALLPCQLWTAGITTMSKAMRSCSKTVSLAHLAEGLGEYQKSRRVNLWPSSQWETNGWNPGEHICMLGQPCCYAWWLQGSACSSYSPATSWLTATDPFLSHCRWCWTFRPRL